MNTLTTAAGGLKVLRARAEAVGVWPSARQRLRRELDRRCSRDGDDTVLDDRYIVAVARR